MFDADRYDREILRPLRGTYGQLPASDLPARYAVEPGMDADELTRHLAAVRAWWQVRAGGPDFRAEVCRLLIRADAELAATVGAAMNDPAWWQEQARMSAGHPPEPPAAEPAPPDPQSPDEETPVPPHDWRAAARAQFWAGLATLDREPPAPAPEERKKTAERKRPEPAAAQPPLTIVPVGADRDHCRIEVSWPARDTADIRVHSSAEPPDFTAGDDLAWAHAREWGEPLAGTPGRRGDLRVLAATVPTGYRIYVPFEVTGERARPGRPVGLSLAGPVRRLRIEAHGGGAMLSWIWSPGSATAEVDWTGSGVSEHRIVTLAEYTAANGCPIEVAHEGGTASVRAVTAVGDGLAYSPSLSVTLDPAPVLLRYTLRRRRRLGGGSDLLVGVTSDRHCTELGLTVVLSSGRFLPLGTADGTVLQRVTGLTLTPDAEWVLRLPWPVLPRGDRPHWLRCFFDAPYPFSPVDPAVDSMRLR